MFIMLGNPSISDACLVPFVTGSWLGLGDLKQISYMSQVMRKQVLGKRELICLLLFTCNYVVSVWRGFPFLWVLGMGYVILLWHSLSLPYNYFGFPTRSDTNEAVKPHGLAVDLTSWIYKLDRLYYLSSKNESMVSLHSNTASLYHCVSHIWKRHVSRDMACINIKNHPKFA